MREKKEGGRGRQGGKFFLQYLEGNIIFHSTAIPLYNGVSQKLVRLYNTAGTDRGQCLVVGLLAVLGLHTPQLEFSVLTIQFCCTFSFKVSLFWESFATVYTVDFYAIKFNDGCCE